MTRRTSWKQREDEAIRSEPRLDATFRRRFILKTTYRQATRQVASNLSNKSTRFRSEAVP